MIIFNSKSRRHNYLKSCLVLALLLVSQVIFAQQIKVSGVVTSSSDGLPLPGVSVLVKGTKKGATTDFDGKYTISAQKGQILQFQFIGMKMQSIKVSKPTLNVKMSEDMFGLEEVVMIGYGAQKKKEVTGAVTSVSAEDITKVATQDLGTALQGQVAGVNVQASSTAPGASANIQIRGVNSISGDNAPLWVVDGIPYEGDPQLSPNEIQSMDILKDAASAAIYGTRGSGGVILVTTKQGKAGEMKVSLNSSVGIQHITSGMNLVNFEDRMYINILNGRTLNGITDDKQWTPLETNRYQFLNDTDLMNDVVLQDNALTQNYNVNLNGGSENLTYSLVGNYFSQEGTMLNSKYNRFNIRGNSRYKKGRLTVNTGLSAAIDNKHNSPWGLMFKAYKHNPYMNLIVPGEESQGVGGPGSNEALNSANLAQTFGTRDEWDGTRVTGNVQLNYSILKDLNFTARGGMNYSNSFGESLVPLVEVYDTEGNMVPTSNRSKYRNSAKYDSGLTFESGLNYTLKLNEHKFKFLGVFSTEYSTHREFYGEKQDIISNDLSAINIGTMDPNAGSGTNQWTQNRVTTRVGTIGRLQYDYKGKYMLSASVRRDGSSRFAPENRWGMFPSFMVGWNISDENFFKPVKDVVNMVKLRASYGTTGNDRFSDYAFSPTISTGYDYVFGQEAGDQLTVGAIQTSYANTDVKWETTVQQNVGVDVALLQNKWIFNADAYISNKQDMLFPMMIPASQGAGRGATVVKNIGNMENKGIELALTYKHQGAFRWSLTGTFTKNINTITQMADSMGDLFFFSDGNPVMLSNADVITGLQVGKPAGGFFLIETDGIADTEEKLAKYQELRPDAKMGDLMWVDKNGNGVLGEDDDRVYSGSGQPLFEAGLNANMGYKGIDFSMQWYTSVGNKVYNGAKAYTYQSSTNQDVVYQWTETNPTSPIPTFRGSSHYNYSAKTDYFLEDGSFLRLRNVTLGYTLPKSLLNKIKTQKIRVYLSADNPLTFTKYSGYNPEVGNNGLSQRGIERGTYPFYSTYRVGLDLKF